MTDRNSTNIVLYDDACPLCTFQGRLLTWLDWFNVMSLLPLSHPSAARVAAGIDRCELVEAIHCVSRSGKIYRGARALRYIGVRMPLLAPLAVLLWTPSVIFVAEKAYMIVSRNRHLLSRLFGCKGACSVMPARKRETDRDSRNLTLEPLEEREMH